MRDDSFKDFVLEQLAGLGGIYCRPMFGGYGVYFNDVFFAIIFDGRLYFKTGGETRPEYVKQGMKPFRPNKKQTLKTYFEVPVDVLEDSDELIGWALKAVSSREEKKVPKTKNR